MSLEENPSIWLLLHSSLEIVPLQLLPQYSNFLSWRLPDLARVMVGPQGYVCDRWSNPAYCSTLSEPSVHICWDLHINDFMEYRHLLTLHAPTALFFGLNSPITLSLVFSNPPSHGRNTKVLISVAYLLPGSGQWQQLGCLKGSQRGTKQECHFVNVRYKYFYEPYMSGFISHLMNLMHRCSGN